MINILKPHIVYSFIKLNGNVEHTEIIIELPENASYSLALGRYDPYNIERAKDEVSQKITKRMSELKAEGWKFSNWHIAHLTAFESSQKSIGMLPDSEAELATSS